MKQEDVAKLVGVSLNTVSLWERDVREPDKKNKKCEEGFDPSKVYYTLSEFFDVPLLYLLGRSDDRDWHYLSDEEAAAVAEEEERESQQHMLEKFNDLSLEMQEVVKITIATMWKIDKERGKLISQQKEEE